jgi:hypothetical protein
VGAFGIIVGCGRDFWEVQFDPLDLPRLMYPNEMEKVDE